MQLTTALPTSGTFNAVAIGNGVAMVAGAGGKQHLFCIALV